MFIHPYIWLNLFRCNGRGVYVPEYILIERGERFGAYRANLYTQNKILIHVCILLHMPDK